MDLRGAVEEILQRLRDGRREEGHVAERGGGHARHAQNRPRDLGAIIRVVALAEVGHGGGQAMKLLKRCGVSGAVIWVA